MEEHDAELTFDFIGFPLTVVASLICLGGIALPYSRPITVLIGLVLLIAARVSLVSLSFTIRGISKAALGVWFGLMGVVGVVTAAAAIRALIVLL